MKNKIKIDDRLKDSKEKLNSIYNSLKEVENELYEDTSRFYDDISDVIDRIERIERYFDFTYEDDDEEKISFEVFDERYETISSKINSLSNYIKSFDKRLSELEIKLLRNS